MAELFANYEWHGAPRWPRLLRIGAVSFVAHALFALSVIYVPAVRDAFNVAAMFSGAEYVDQDYKKTVIGERAQVIDLADPGARFQYPEGYFAIEQPPNPYLLDPQLAVVDATVVAPPPVIIPKPRSIPTPKAVTTPTPVAKPTPSPLASPSPSVATNAGSAAANSNSQTSETESERSLDKIAAENNIKRPRTINSKPFKDWLAAANKKKTAGQLDLTGPVEMTIEADRKPDGTLDNVEVTQKTGDERLVEVTKDFVAALSASGVLDFLEGTDHLMLVVKMNDNDVSVSVSTEMQSEKIATERARGYNALLVVGALSKRGHDEEVVYKNTKVSSNGKQIVVSFTMPRKTAGEVLSKQVPTS